MVSVAALRRYVVAHQGYTARFRRARIDDVAATILSLATGSPLITGQVLVVDGGMLMGR